MPTFDVIVLGCGGFGSAACYHLAKRGVRVLGLEQFPFVHDRGSSHGDTRIIRLAYFEHPNYVPLLLGAYDLWDQLERETEQTLFRKTRLLLAGPSEGETITGAIRAATEHQLTIERMSAAEARRTFPDFGVRDDQAVVVEPDAGFLWVERCVQTHLDAARQHGAILLENSPVVSWTATNNGVSVTTDRETYHAARLVITAGPWAASVMKDLRLPLVVSRKFVGWFATTGGAYGVDAGYPVYYREQPDGAFYGFPSLDGATIKVAEHSGVDTVTDPGAVDRSVRPSDLDRLQRFVRQFLPRATPQLIRHSVCLYTHSPDGHFMVDRHPAFPTVTLAAGFSGHGFKFTSVLGAALADLALTGNTSWPIEFLRLGRLRG